MSLLPCCSPIALAYLPLLAPGASLYVCIVPSSRLCVQQSVLGLPYLFEKSLGLLPVVRVFVWVHLDTELLVCPLDFLRGGPLPLSK